MSVAKVVESTASSPKSLDEATEQGVRKACETLENVRGAWIKEMKTVVENGRISEYRGDLKVSFVLQN